MAKEKKAWRSKFGFYLASVGTALGLGNLWRFPYVVSDYGGGAFVFLYILLALFIGVPLAISEISLGKFLHEKGLTIGELIRKKGQKGKRFMEFSLWIPISLSFVVLSYYSVLSGWTFHMIIRSIVSYNLAIPFEGTLSFITLKKNVWLQILLSSVHLILIFSILIKGVKAGIEKWLSFSFPVLLFCLVFVSFKYLAAKDLFDAAKYIIYPNFHMLTFKSFSYALGHLLFTMSLGFAALTTFGGYLPRKDSAATAGVRVAIIDAMVSIALGFVIFPIVILSDYQGPMSEALFQAFPKFINGHGLEYFFSFGFYLCILIAAVNTSLSLTEVIIDRLFDSFKWKRKKSLIVLFFTVLMSSSMIIFLHKNWSANGSFIELLDDVTINYVLPFGAICLSLIALWYVDKSFLREEFEAQDQVKTITVYKSWRFFIYFMMPGIYLFSLILRNFF